MKKLLLLLFTPFMGFAQNAPIDFEPGGHGNSWTWTVFENGTNPAVQMVSNPDVSAVNPSSTVARFDALTAGQPWAGFESMHGSDIGPFVLDSNNSLIKVMVYKSVISDVGVKLVTPSNASLGEIKVANTKINEWEEISFDFSSQVGNPISNDLDQIVIFPDFQARTTDNICYIDNIHFGNYVAPPLVDVTFQVQNPPSTPVYVFGNWNNWSNFPGTMMTDTGDGIYEVTISMIGNRDIEFQYVSGADSSAEELDYMDSCTNGNPDYTNRLLTLDSTNISYCALWEDCYCIPESIADLDISDTYLITDRNGIEIHSNDFQSFDNITVYDLLGRSLYQQDDISVHDKVSILLQPHEIYLITLRKDGRLHTFKTSVR